MTEIRNRAVNIRLTSDEFETVAEAAECLSATVSDLVRVGALALAREIARGGIVPTGLKRRTAGKSKSIAFRGPLSLFQHIEQLAEREGLTPSTWLRQVVAVAVIEESVPNKSEAETWIS